MNPRFISRLARSTILSKIDSSNPPERPGFDFRLISPKADLSSKLVVPLCRQALETNLLILARLAAARQLAFPRLLTFLIPSSQPEGAIRSTSARTQNRVAQPGAPDTRDFRVVGWSRPRLCFRFAEHRHSFRIRPNRFRAECRVLTAFSQHHAASSFKEAKIQLNKERCLRSFRTLQELKAPEYQPRGVVPLGAIWWLYL